MNSRHDEVPDNAALYPAAFAQQKSIKHCVALQQHRVRGPWNTEWARDVLPLLLCQRSMCHHKPHPISSNNQVTFGHVVPVITRHLAAHSPI